MKSGKKRNRSLRSGEVKPDQVSLVVRSACAIVGVIFALVGLIIIAFGNLMMGGSLTAFGLLFIALALKFTHVKLKGPFFEIEADQSE